MSNQVSQIQLDDLSTAQRPMFFCSFGKDSSCVLHALGSLLNKILVVFIDCGGLYPEIEDWALQEGAKLPKFFYLKHPEDFWEISKQRGFPLDFELPELGRFGELLGATPLAAKLKIRSWTDCIYERVWLPMTECIKAYRGDVVITAERRQDRPYGQWWDHRDGVQFQRPIFEWQDQDVWEYVDAHHIRLPRIHQSRSKERRDCWACLGHDLTAERIADLRREQPDLYHKLFTEGHLGEAIPTMIDLLEKKTQVLRGIQRVVEEDV